MKYYFEYFDTRERLVFGSLRARDPDQARQLVREIALANGDCYFKPGSPVVMVLPYEGENKATIAAYLKSAIKEAA